MPRIERLKFLNDEWNNKFDQIQLDSGSSVA